MAPLSHDKVPFPLYDETKVAPWLRRELAADRKLNDLIESLSFAPDFLKHWSFRNRINKQLAMTGIKDYERSSGIEWRYLGDIIDEIDDNEMTRRMFHQFGKPAEAIKYLRNFPQEKFKDIGSYRLLPYTLDSIEFVHNNLDEVSSLLSKSPAAMPFLAQMMDDSFFKIMPVRFLKYLWRNNGNWKYYIERRYNLAHIRGTLNILSPVLGTKPVDLKLHLIVYARSLHNKSKKRFCIETALQLQPMDHAPGVDIEDDWMLHCAEETFEKYFPYHQREYFKRMYLVMQERVCQEFTRVLDQKGLLECFKDIKGEDITVNLHSNIFRDQRLHAELTDGFKTGKIDTKFLYAHGANIFDEVAHDESYQLAESEAAILQQNSEEIIKIGAPEVIVSLGPSSQKDMPLLTAMLRQNPVLSHERQHRPRYIGYDISLSAIHAALKDIRSKLYGTFPIKFVGMEGDIEHLKPDLSAVSSKLLLLLGNTLGNFETEDQKKVLKGIAESMGTQDSFLVGVDLRQDQKLLETEYNTPVMDKFFLSFLQKHCISAGNLDADTREVFNTTRSRMERTVTLNKNHVFQVNGQNFLYFEGEDIEMGISQKYRVEDFEKMVEQSGLKIVKIYFDEGKNFGVYFLKVREKSN